MCGVTKIWHALWASLFLLFAFNAAVAESGQPGKVSVDPVLGVQGKVSVWSYSKMFAKRFSLPEMADERLPSDVWAMEFRLVWRILDGDASFYDCELHVYINNKLKILYPEGDVGSIETLRMEKPAQPAKMPNAEDRLFHGKQSSSYNLKAVFSSKSKKNSLGGTVPYQHYRKYFLSDVAYLAFSLSGCSAFGNPDEYQFSWWLEKEGGRDYRQWSKLDPNDFYQFEISKAFVQRFYPHAKLAADLNSCDTDEQNRKRRDNRTKEYWEKRNKECSQLRNTRLPAK